MGNGGICMAGINTSINLHDGMTSVLNSMYKGVSHLVGGFRDMQGTVNRGFSTSAFDNFKQHMSDAISKMGIMEREAQKAAGIVQKAFDWKKQMNFDVFGGSGTERFKQEADGITIQMQRVIEQQKYIENKALSMKLLPKNAVSDIAETSMQLRNLISSMEQLKNIDVNKLSEGQKNKFNTEFERMRHNIISARQIQNNVGYSVKSDDVSGVNSGFNQIKSIIQQTEMQLRSFKNELNQINSFSWQSMNGTEVFSTKGLTRAKQEINSAKSMAEELIQTQQKITSKAEKMKMLPPTAISEIQNINNRIGGIQNTISRLEKEKKKLSRWNVSGVNLYNQRIESLRQKMYEAKQAQIEVNNAVKNNDVEKLNSAYKRLVNTIDRIDIDIRDNNSAQQQFNNSLNNGNKNALNLGNHIRNIGNQLKMYAGMALGGFGLKSVFGATDTYANLSARLGLITKSQTEVKVLQDKIFESAQRTGTAYTDMASTTAKLGLLAGDAFKNNTELNKFSELMAKSFKVSGASTQEQAAGMYQLTQAMASGRLQGDEFRSIIENAPMLAQAISDYTGVGMDGLKEMSREGTISAEIIKNALFLAGKDIEEKYAQMPKTFSSYFAEIKNTAFMEFSGIMQGINNAINTDGFKKFVENVKLSIGNAAEWAILRFYEFKNTFSQLWSSAQPTFKAISNGFIKVRNYIFSANGLLGQFIKTMSQLFNSAALTNIISSLSEVFMIFGNSIMMVINFIVNLITKFDWLGGTVVQIIAFIKIFNTVNSITQNIVKNVSNAVSIFTQRTTAQTAATNGAAAAQRGLNAVMSAHPYNIVASAISAVISLMMMLSLKIDEINAKAGGMVISYTGTHSLKVKDMQDKYKVDSITAAQMVSEQEKGDSELEQISKRKRELEQSVYDNEKKLEEAKSKVKSSENTYSIYKDALDSNGILKGLPHISIWDTFGDFGSFGIFGTKDKYSAQLNEAETNYNIAQKALENFEKGDYSKMETIKHDMNKKIAGLKNNYDIQNAKEAVTKANTSIQDAMMKIEMGKLKAGDGAVAGGDKDKKKNVGTVDKIKDTVDITSEDLKFMRDFAERDIINKIQTTNLAPQINVSFEGEIKETVDVNAFIGRITDELAEAVNNSAQGVHI